MRTWFSQLRNVPSRVLLLIFVLFTVLVAGNAHFVYTAITSDPGCVAHQKTVGTEPGQFRAARSHCRTNKE